MILIIKTKKYIVLLTFYYLLKIDFSLTYNSKKTKRTIGGKDQKAASFPGNDTGGIGWNFGENPFSCVLLERTGKVNKYTLQEIAGILKTIPDDLEAGITLEEDRQPAYSATNSEELINQLR